MTPTQEFWWNWGVQAAVAVGTIGAVVIALFGEAIRARLFPPMLVLDVARPEGLVGVVPTVDEHGHIKGLIPARWYHLNVTNTRRWSPVRNARVVVTRVDRRGPDGTFQQTWDGELPLRWANEEHTSKVRTIGAPARADLCALAEGSGAALIQVSVRPPEFPAVIEKDRPILVYLQARGDEGDSPVLALQIAWDGQWHAGSQEMRRSFVISRHELPTSPGSKALDVVAKVAIDAARRGGGV